MVDAVWACLLGFALTGLYSACQSVVPKEVGIVRIVNLLQGNWGFRALVSPLVRKQVHSHVYHSRRWNEEFKLYLQDQGLYSRKELSKEDFKVMNMLFWFDNVAQRINVIN